MEKTISIESLVASCNALNVLKLHTKKSNNSICCLVSEKYPDLNIEVKKSKNGFKVEYYNSTLQFETRSAITEDKLVKGLTLLLSPNIEPDDQDVSSYLNW